MASVGFGTVAPAAVAPSSPAARTSLAGRQRARVPAATKVVTSASAAKQQQQQEKGLFDTIFGALYKEEQLLETDPILNKVQGKAAAAPAPKKAAAPAEDSGNGGFSLGGLFSKPKKG